MKRILAGCVLLLSYAHAENTSNSFSIQSYHPVGDRSQDYHIVQQLFTGDELRTMRQIELPAAEIADRKVAYVFEVFRIEHILREHPIIFEKFKTIIDRAVHLSDLASFVGERHYEIEYLVYDVANHDQKPSIELHQDNGSLITLILMLSQPNEFEGGELKFEYADEPVSLGTGDLVLFQGQWVKHWLTPVTSGRRVVIQIEFAELEEEGYLEKHRKTEL